MNNSNCPKCNSTLRPDAKYCPYCGNEISRAKFCSNCGTAIQSGARFCPSCGQGVTVAPAQTTSPQVVSGTGNSQADDLSLIGYWAKCFKNYANFEGRARRKEFWGFGLFNAIFGGALFFLAGIIGVETGETEAVLGCFYITWCLVIFLPALAVTARRLHDIGKSGWLQLLCIIPFIGFILLLIWGCTEGDRGDNKYGANTK